MTDVTAQSQETPPEVLVSSSVIGVPLLLTAVRCTLQYILVSFEPRLVAVGLQKTSHSYGLVAESKVFAVNLLRTEDQGVVKAFTKGRAKNPDKMKDVEFSRGPATGCPVLPEAAAYLECRVVEAFDAGGDHDVVVGEVINAEVRKPGTPGETLNLPAIGWNYAG